MMKGNFSNHRFGAKQEQLRSCFDKQSERYLSTSTSMDRDVHSGSRDDFSDGNRLLLAMFDLLPYVHTLAAAFCQTAS